MTRSSWVLKVLNQSFVRSKTLYFVNLQHLPIYEQLVLEESLFRLNRNPGIGWFFINNYTTLKPHELFYSIVLGLSGKPSLLIKERALIENPAVSLIRRFTGGGTVLLTKDAIMPSFILPQSFFMNPVGPDGLMLWTGKIYKKVIGESFSCQELDYIFKETQTKFGGNAQAFNDHNMVHHSSLLWHVDYNLMNRFLKQPAKQPKYRQHRRHDHFLSSISESCGDRFESSNEFVMRLVKSLSEIASQDHQFTITKIDYSDFWEDAQTCVQAYMRFKGNKRSTWKIDYQGQKDNAAELSYDPIRNKAIP